MTQVDRGAVISSGTGIATLYKSPVRAYYRTSYNLMSYSMFRLYDGWS